MDTPSEKEENKELDSLVAEKVVDRGISLGGGMNSTETECKILPPDSSPLSNQDLKPSEEMVDLRAENLLLKARIRELEGTVNKDQVVVVLNVLSDVTASAGNETSEKQSNSQGSVQSLESKGKNVEYIEKDSLSTSDHPIEEVKQLLENKKVELKDLQMELQSIKDEFLRFRKQSESNAKAYEQKVESLSEQLVHAKTGRGSHSRTFLDSFAENESVLIGAGSSFAGTSICDESHSTDIDHSTGHGSSMDDMEEPTKKIAQLTQSLIALEMKQKDLKRKLADAEEEREHQKSVIVDLQQQVDASSPEVCSELRAMIQNMETEITRLMEDKQSLHNRLTKHGILDPEDNVVETTVSEEETEELVDCSFDIMGELVNTVPETELGISLSYVQYAGLLAAIQKAIKQLQETQKNSGNAPINSFRALDRSLSRSLSLSSVRVRGPQGEGQKRLDQLNLMLEEKKSGLQFMEEMIGQLHDEIQGHRALSVQQEVQLEYLKQQLSNPEKVISLTWEVENLRRSAEDNQRELKALRDLQDQQQQELAIQWQSKQQAVAEKLSQHHAVSSYSQQLEHWIEANEALQSEKVELEEALQVAKNEAKQERQKLCVEMDSLRQELKSEKSQPRGLMTTEETQEILQQLRAAEETMSKFKVLFGELSGIQNGLKETQEVQLSWIEEMNSEKENFQKEKNSMMDKIKIAEGLKTRAEEEKAGVQEILSSTLEDTSKEMITLQNQVKELKSKLQAKQDSLKEAVSKISSQDSQIQQFQQLLKEQDLQKAVEIKELNEKLQLAQADRLHLEEYVKNYKEVISGLNKDLGSYEMRLKEASKNGETHFNSFRLEQEKTSLMKRTLEELQSQLADKRAQCGRLEEVEVSIRVLLEEKATLQTEVGELRVERRNQEQEISVLKSEISESKEKISEGMKQRLILQETISSLKQQIVDETACWEAELARVGDLTVPREQWLDPVNHLVEHCEALVAERCEEEAERKLEGIRKLLRESEEKLKAVELEGKENLQEVEEANWNLQEKVENLQNEMKSRETTLKEEILDLKESFSIKINDLTEELEETKELCTTFQEENKTSTEEWKKQAEEKSQQIMEVQEKARELMQEKEKEISNLKQSFTESAVENSEITPEELEDDNPEKKTIAKLRNEIVELKKSLADSEHTHELRDRASEVLKHELQECQRSIKRESIDIEYVKNVLVDAFEKGTLPRTSPMLVVLARLLHFSPVEMERIQISALPSPPRSVSSGSNFLQGWFKP